MRVSCWALGIVFALLSGAEAQESARQTLPGFKGFRFGMTEQEARRVSELGPAISEKARTRFKAAAPVVVDGVAYEFSVTVTAGKLDTILLSSQTKVSEFTCRNDYQRALSLVQSRYGRPDRPPNIKSDKIMTTASADFTFRDGNSIAVSSFFIQDCLITVAYLRGKPGETF